MEGIYDNLQQLPAGWERVKIGDEIEVIRGASPRPKGDPRYFGGSIPWIMISDVTKENGKFISKTRDHVTQKGAEKSRYLKAGTLILSNSATVCVPKILGVDGCIHDGFVAFPNIPRRFDILYLYYFFEFIRPRVIDAHRQGITQVNLNTTIVKNIQVPIAPTNEQKRIVAEIEKQFSRLDEAVANLKRVKANLKRYKAAVLKAAVEGKLTEQWRKAHPDVEPASELLKRILADRRAKWSGKGKYKEPNEPDTLDLPRLPESWVWATLPQLGELNRGKSMHRPRNDPKLYGGSYPFIQTGDVRYATGTIKTYTQTYSDEGLKQSRLWPMETLCITIAANIADTAILGFAACFPDSVVGFIPATRHTDVQFLEYFLRTAKENIERFAPATAQKNINLEILRDVAVPFPPEGEQRAIIVEVEHRLSMTESIEVAVGLSTVRVERLRQSILTCAFSGQLPSSAERETISDVMTV